MNRKERIAVVSLLTLALAGGVFASNSFAANAQPGTTGDPLVTKSYVDDKINQLINGGVAPSGTGTSNVNNQEIVSDVMAQIEFLYGNQLKGNASGTKQNASSYVPVSAKSGQVIIGHEGTEIILRSGDAVGYCPGENGLVNVTKGTDIGNAIVISANNLLIVPRYDGRGVQVLNDAWFMIKGGYDLLN